MLSKRYESTEVDRRTWLHVPSGTHWSTSSDTHQVVEIQIETSTKMYTPFLIGLNFLDPSLIRFCHISESTFPLMAFVFSLFALVVVRYTLTQRFV